MSVTVLTRGDETKVDDADVPRARRLRNQAWFQRSVVWGVLLVVYEIAAQRAGSFFLPTVADIVRGYGTIFSEDGIELVLNSYRQMLVGYGLAVVVGIPLGLLIGSSRVAKAAFGWIVDALFVTSMVALLPFIILLAGTDFRFRVAVVFGFASFYLIMNPAAGVRSIDPELREMSRSFGASRLRTTYSVTAPSVLPFILAGMRLAMGQAIQGMIVAELWIAAGTGRKLQGLGLARELGEFFALASLVVVLGVVLSSMFQALQRYVTPWATRPTVAAP